MDGGGGLNLTNLLGAVEEAPPLDAVDALAAELAAAVGASDVALLIANLSGDALVHLSHVRGARGTAGQNERSELLPLRGTARERALVTQDVIVAAARDQWEVLLPVSERGDAIGLLELKLDVKPDAEVLDFLSAAAHALAYVLIAVRRHTDLFEWGQRTVPFSVAAEIQRRLLPSSYTAETGPVTLAGWLEPSHNAGGDTFDYSLDREYLYLSMTDAMGHSTKASLLATLVVGTLRNFRRAAAGPVEQAEAAAAELRANVADDQFVTGLIARLHLVEGTVEIVNAGHPPPYLVREGRARALELAVRPPLGVGSGHYQAETFTLQPGDRLVMVTDGYLDRHASDVDIEGLLAAAQDRHPRQVAQELARGVLTATGGQLRDDATVLCVDFYGPAGWRSASSGASHARATRP